MKTERPFPKADPLVPSDVVQDLTVVFSADMPRLEKDDPDWHAKYLLFYQNEADRFLRAIERVVPGGFMDALLGALLARKAVVYRVADRVLAERNRAHDLADQAIAALNRVRAQWPHIEVRDYNTQWGTKDPGAPTCLRCMLEREIGPEFPPPVQAERRA